RLPFLKGLRHDIPKLKWLNWSARDFDRLFLNDLSAEDWTRIVNEFSNNITDSIIEKAVNRLPDKIFSISGPTIIEKLKSRREVLKTKALDYYKFISSYVNIPGSNMRSEEHTSELQSRENLVCRLLLEKKKTEHQTKQQTS